MTSTSKESTSGMEINMVDNARCEPLPHNESVIPRHLQKSFKVAPSEVGLRLVGQRPEALLAWTQSPDPSQRNCSFPAAPSAGQRAAGLTYFCPACVDYFRPTEKHLHLSSPWTCPTCSKRLHVEWQQRHLSRHASKERKRPNYPLGTAKAKGKGKTYYCTICGKEEPLDDQPQHLSPAWQCPVCKKSLHIEWKEKHLARHETDDVPEKQLKDPCLESDTSKFKHVNKTVSCTVCGIRYALHLQRYHISPAWTCVVCSKTMHVSDQKGHLAGNTHYRRCQVQNSSLESRISRT